MAANLNEFFAELHANPASALAIASDESPLSAAEAALLDAANRDEAQRRKLTAEFRAIKEAILDYDIGWESVLEQPTAGEVAAKLYALWEPVNRAEPFVESEYANTGIYADLSAALNAHGLATYDERCAELGKRLVDSARKYILSCYSSMADDAEAEAGEERREYLRGLQRRMQRAATDLLGVTYD
jgi:hypothetical protein